MSSSTPPPTPPRRGGNLLKRIPPPAPLAPLSSSSFSPLGLSLVSSTSTSSTPSLNTQLKHLLLGDSTSGDSSLSTLRPFSTAPNSPPRPPPRPRPTPSPSPPAPRRPQMQPHSPPLNAHEALYGPYSPSDDCPPFIPYAQPARASAFFVSCSGTQRLGGGGGARKPLPIPPTSPSSPGGRTPPSAPRAQLPLPYPGQPSLVQIPSSFARAPSRATTKIPLAASSRIVAHSGFWDLMAATGSRFYSPSKLGRGGIGVTNGLATPWSPDMTAGTQESDPFAREMGKKVSVPPPVVGAAAGATGGTAAGKKKKRISVDMVGNPKGFQHTVHASDAEQAEALLMRWGMDRQGKVAQLGWAQPIKEAVRAAGRAAGIAEAQYARDEALEDGSGLKVINGLPDSVIKDTGTEASIATDGAVEDEDHLERLEEPTPLSRVNSTDSVLLRSPLPASPPFPSPADTYATGGTTRFAPDAFSRPGVPLSFDRPGALGLQSAPYSPTFDAADPFSLPPTFVPSLPTIERAASTKIFLETRYHALLRQPKSRDARKALLEQELAKLSGLSEREKERVRMANRLAETDYLRETRKKVGINSYDKLKTIGHGAFGVVSLVREKETGQVFAMKQLRKADVLKKGQEGHIRAERDLLAAAATTTRWTVPLASSFQDMDHLYLVMNYMAGGDLLSLLIEKDTFPEQMARFYLAEMVLAIEETHKVLGAIHRDIKPDNFLFDSYGHLAIADFGLACDFQWFHDGAYFERHRATLLTKYGIDLDDGLKGSVARRNAAVGAPFDPPQREDDDEVGPPSLLGWRERGRRKLAFSTVGTSNYMAVEVLRSQGYGEASDWWSLGVIAFEMLYGYPPFVSKSRQETKQKILAWRNALRFPSRPRISREAQDFICSLICEPEHRLGSRSCTAAKQRPNSVIQRQRSGFLNVSGGDTMLSGVADDGAHELRAHPFFKGIDWKTLHLQTPPFVPMLKDAVDTRYFDDDIAPEPLPAPEIAPGVPAPDTACDPLLRHPVEGEHLLALRKQQAFVGWTYKKPKTTVYDARRGRIDVEGVFGKEGAGGAGSGRGRAGSRVDGAPGSSFIRSLSV